MTLAPGDRVRVRAGAQHTPRLFLGREGEVVEVRRLGDRPWAQIAFADRPTTWLPLERLEPVAREPAT